MIIAQISDTHLLADNSNPDAQVRRIENFERAVAHIHALEPQPDVVLHTGDISHNATAHEYGLAREILSGLESPLLATVGNRDRRAPFAGAFASDGYLPRNADFVQYAVELDGLRIVAADTLSETVATGTYCRDRLADLETILTQAPDTPTLLFLHHPPIAVPALSNPYQFERDAAARLTELIRRHTQIIRVLCGHTHRADSVALGQISVTSVPSIATDLRRDRYPESLTDVPVYQLHLVGDDGSVVSRTCAVPATE